MNELGDWILFANGSGAVRAVADGYLDRLRLHLAVVPRDPINHMKLLAINNRKVAGKERPVSPFCHLSFINSDARFQPKSNSLTERGEVVPFQMNLLVGGLDLSELTRDFMRNSEALFKGALTKIPELDIDKVNERLKRRG